MYRVDAAFKLLDEAFPNVHYLNNNEINIDGINFVGSTLWTDFKLSGYIEHKLEAYANAISDFKVIRIGDKLFTPKYCNDLHTTSCMSISGRLRNNKDGRNVVITHFMPSQEVISPYWTGNALNPYFCNDMDYMINEFQPELWVYGHTHDKGDKLHSNGKTRMVANPRGYPREKKDNFKWKIIEI